jgi:DNA polymerase-3 subunit delta
MAYLKPEQFEAALRSGRLGSLYLFDGPEAWLKDQAVQSLIDKLVAPESRDFNLEKFSGTSCAAGAVVTAVQSLPFLGERRVVVLQQASELSAAEQRIVADGIADLASSTCLIMTVEGKANLREPLIAASASQGNIVTFWPPFANQLPGWVVNEARRRGKAMTMDAAAALAEACTDLQQISNELDKIFLYVGDKKTIDGSDIKRHGLPDQEGDTKELERTLWTRDLRGALEQGKLLSEMGVRGEMLFPVVERVFRSLMLGTLYKNERRMDADDIAAELGMRSRTAIDQLKMGLKSYRPDELRTSFNKIAQADFEMKVGALPSAVAVSLLLLNLCGKTPPHGRTTQPLANFSMRAAK